MIGDKLGSAIQKNYQEGVVKNKVKEKIEILYRDETVKNEEAKLRYREAKEREAQIKAKVGEEIKGKYRESKQKHDIK